MERAETHVTANRITHTGESRESSLRCGHRRFMAEFHASHIRPMIRNRHPHTIDSIKNLSGLLQAKGDLDAAQRMLREAN